MFCFCGTSRGISFGVEGMIIVSGIDCAAVNDAVCTGGASVATAGIGTAVAGIAAGNPASIWGGSA